LSLPITPEDEVQYRHTLAAAAETEMDLIDSIPRPAAARLC